MRKFKLFVTVGVGVVFALAIVLFLFTFTVRFTEVAVATRFGDARTVIDGGERPGLHFKLPYPIDSVTKYDTRVRLVQLRKEAQQTADNRQVIVEAFCTWRVDDPSRFFKRFSSEGERTEVHYEGARDAIRTRLRTAVGEISRYAIDELFSVETRSGEHPRLAELEGRILDALRTPNDAGETLEQLMGVRVADVGISSIVLPEETSKAVLDRMKQDRRTLVQEIDSQAQSEAQAIRSAAETDRDRIEAFAEVRAQEIRALGDVEAQQYLAQMGEHEGLAVFLEAVDFVRDFYARKATLVISTNETFFKLFDPNVIAATGDGQVPGVEGMPGMARDGAEPAPSEATAEPEPAAMGTPDSDPESEPGAGESEPLGPRAEGDQ